MSRLTFTKATKKRARARVALMGPGGSGKTWTALELATALGEKVAVIDSERGSASKYSDRFSFDVLELDSYGPERYIDAIVAAEEAGYDVIVIDSLSHAWAGKDGVLERVDRKGGFNGGGWRDVTPLQNRLLDAITAARAHIIATLRVKTEYAMDKNDKGKVVPRKVGLAPVQKDGLEYEFDVVASLDEDNRMSIEKTRCSLLHGRVWQRQVPEVAAILKAWLTDGEAAPAPPQKQETTPPKAESRGTDSSTSSAHSPRSTQSGPTPSPGSSSSAPLASDPEHAAALADIREAVRTLGWEEVKARSWLRDLVGVTSTHALTKPQALEAAATAKALVAAARERQANGQLAANAAAGVS